MNQKLTHLITFILATNPAAFCSISTLYSDALKFDEDLQAAKGSLQQAEGQQFGSFYSFVPAPIITYTKSRQTNTFSSGVEQISHPSALNLSVTQSLSAEKVFNTLGSNKSVQSAKANYRAEHGSLLNDLINNYAVILSTYESLQASKTQTAYLKRTYQQEQEKYRIGSSTKANVAQARAAYDVAFAQQVSQKQNLDKSLNELFALTGKNYDKLGSLSKSEQLDQVFKLNHINTYQTAATKNNGTLIASKRHVEAQKMQLNSSVSKFLPYITYGVSYTKNENNKNSSLVYTLDNNKTATIGLAYNLSANPGTIIYQNGALNTAIANNRSVVTNTLASITTAYNGVNASKESVRRYKNAVKSSKISLQATQKAYAAGSMTLLDVLNAVNELQINESTYAQKRYEYLSYYTQLRTLAGDKPEAILSTIDRLMDTKVNVRVTSA